MVLDATCIFSFDNCSILSQCQFSLPPAIQFFFGGSTTACRKNRVKLISLCTELDKLKIPKYRFSTPFFNKLVTKFGKDFFADNGIPLYSMKFNIQTNITKQLIDFMAKTQATYSIIPRNKDILQIKQIFQANKKSLKKGQIDPKENIPEDEDFEILKGLKEFPAKGIKHIISEDEHFWGYKDVIAKHLQINVVEEWDCCSLI